MKPNLVLVVVAICCEDTIAFDTSFCGFCFVLLFDVCVIFVMEHQTLSLKVASPTVEHQIIKTRS
jgi:hypothetical protein